jgi:hypothetical protein
VDQVAPIVKEEMEALVQLVEEQLVVLVVPVTVDQLVVLVVMLVMLV